MGLMKGLQTLGNVYVQKKYPVSLIHFVTNRCNARCPFCFIDFDDEGTQDKKNELSLEEIRKLTRKLGPSLQNVNITGGEPFLRKDLVDIARAYFDHAGLGSILINSNGSLPKRVEELARALLSEYPDKMIFFVFSIDSFPVEHAKIRKIPELFDKVIESYRIAKQFGPSAVPTINLTVTPQNHAIVCKLYDTLRDEYGVQSFNAVIARDQGVYRTPTDEKAAILASYKELTGKILADLSSGRVHGFDTGSLRGKLINSKNHLQYRIIADTYLEPKYNSPCPAGAILGVIGCDGSVHPCEILSKPMGNLRDYDFDFLELWTSSKAREIKGWIRESRCNCHWECAWTYNILSNLKYQPKLLKNVVLGS